MKYKEYLKKQAYYKFKSLLLLYPLINRTFQHESYLASCNNCSIGHNILPIEKSFALLLV